MPRRRRFRRLARRLGLTAVALPPVVLVVVLGVHLAFRDEGRLRLERARAAEEALEDGRLAEARVLLTRLKDERPRDVHLRTSLAACLHRLERREEAAAQARRAVEVDPEFAPAHALLSRLALEAGDAAGAVAEARLAYRGREVADGAGSRLALLLLSAGRTREATSVLTEVMASGRGGARDAVLLATLVRPDRIEGPARPRTERILADLVSEADPDEPTLRLRLGALWALARASPDRVPEIEAAATDVLARRPRDEYALASRALARLGLGRPEAALRDARAIVMPGPCLLVALAAEQAGESRVACALYERVLAFRPLDPVALNNLAHHLSRDPATARRAVSLARAAVALAPDSADCRDTLAAALAASSNSR